MLSDSSWVTFIIINDAHKDIIYSWLVVKKKEKTHLTAGTKIIQIYKNIIILIMARWNCNVAKLDLDNQKSVWNIQ